MEAKETGSAQLAPGKSMLGRGVAIVLPLVFIVILVLVFFPMRYFYCVDDGKLGLWAGKIGWIDARRSLAVEPFLVENAGDFKDLTAGTFSTEEEAVTALRNFLPNLLEKEQEKVSVLEKELVNPYTLLLGYLKGARSVGIEGLDRRIEGIQNWLSFYSGEPEQKAEEKKTEVGKTEEVPATVTEKEPGAEEKEAEVEKAEEASAEVAKEEGAEEKAPETAEAEKPPCEESHAEISAPDASHGKSQ